MVTARGKEGHLDADGLRAVHHDVETEDIVVEVRSPPKVGDPQMGVADTGLWVDGFSHAVLLVFVI